MTGNTTGDDDHDGIPNSLEYAMITNPHQFTPSLTGQLQSVTVNTVANPYLTTTFRRLVDANDIIYHIDWSTDCQAWNETAVRVNSTVQYDGTLTETWRSPVPATGAAGFLRVRITPP